MSCLLSRSRVRWLAAVALPLLLLALEPLRAQDEKLNLSNYYQPMTFCFSPDGKKLAIGSGAIGSTESVFQVAIVPLSPKGNPVYSKDEFKVRGAKTFASLAVSPDERTWATLIDGKIDLWDGITTKPMDKVALTENDQVTQLVFLDRRTLLIAGATKDGKDTRGLLLLWDTKTNEKISEFNPATRVQQLHLSPDQSLLTLIDGADTVRLWTIKKKDDKYDLAEKATLTGHKGVTCQATSPDGKKMLTGGTDKKVRLWDVATNKEITFLRGHADAVTWVAFSPDGMPISWSLDGTVRLWDVKADREAKVWKRDGYLSCYQISPDGTKLATGGPSGVLVWDLTKMTKDQTTEKIKEPKDKPK